MKFDASIKYKNSILYPIDQLTFKIFKYVRNLLDVTRIQKIENLNIEQNGDKFKIENLIMYFI